MLVSWHTHNKNKQWIFMSQKHYADTILEWLRMTDCQPSSTPGQNLKQLKGQWKCNNHRRVSLCRNSGSITFLSEWNTS
jgi:hypothetical protein